MTTKSKPKSKATSTPQENLLFKALIDSGFDEQFVPEVLKKTLNIHSDIILEGEFLDLGDALESLETIQSVILLLKYYGDYTTPNEVMSRKKK